MKTVLIIEDNAEARRLLARSLRKNGFAVTECGTLKEGLEIARSIPSPDVIMLDLGLSDSEPEPTLQSIPAFGDIPVIVWTGIEDPDLIREGRRLGAKGFITKGSSSDSIIERILLVLAEEGDDTESRRAVWKNRREHFHPVPRFEWLTTGKAFAGMAVAIAVQFIAVGTFIWNQSAANALFRNEVKENTASAKAIEPRVTSLEEKATRSIDDRANLTKRLDAYQNDVNGLRKDMNEGFSRIQTTQNDIYKLLITLKP